MSDLHGRFTWYELMTLDPAAAQSFYGDVVGLGTQAWEGGDKPYTMWMAGDRPLGGVMTLPDEAKAAGAPPHWIAYIGSDDIDATAAKAKELGGDVVVGPMAIPKVGRFAVMKDPQGAVFAAIQPEGEMHPVEQDRPGSVGWNELMTSDNAAAYSFYQALFGWDKTDAMDMGEAGTYQMYGLGGGSFGGMMVSPPNHPAPPMWLYYFNVADLDASLAKAKARDAKLLNGPMDVPGGGRIAQLLDPQGVAFAVYQPAAKAG